MFQFSNVLGFNESLRDLIIVLINYGMLEIEWYFISTKMQAQVEGFKHACYSSQNLFQLCYPYILKGDDGNFTHVNDIKSKVGVEIQILCNVPLPRTTKSSPTLFIIIETLWKQIGNIDLSCTPIRIIQYLCSVTL